MTELGDKAAGTIKETAGAAAGDRELEANGKFQRLRGNIKGAYNDFRMRVRDFFRSSSTRTAGGPA